MADLSLIGMTAALLAGAISFVSPCVLPLVPGYVSYIAGRSVGGAVTPGRGQVVWLSLWFVLGFSTIFMILGASATALGQLMLRWRYELNFLGGGIIILFGLLRAWARLRLWLDSLHRPNPRRDPDGERDECNDWTGRDTACDLLRRTWHPVPDRRRVHRPPYGSFAWRGTFGPPSASGCGRGHDPYGDRHDHRSAQRPVILVTRCVSGVGKDRVIDGS